MRRECRLYVRVLNKTILFQQHQLMHTDGFALFNPDKVNFDENELPEASVPVQIIL